MISTYLSTNRRPAVVGLVSSTPAGRTDPFISTDEGEDDDYDERWRRPKFNSRVAPFSPVNVHRDDLDVVRVCYS